MSFEKLEIEKIFKYISEIKDETLTKVIVSDELEIIDLLIHLSSEFSKENEGLSHYFDEINSDMVAILLNAITGNYRLSICGLRGVLELLCHAFYYDDHMVEYRMFDTENEQATRYVTTLINEQDFFKSKYIKALQSSSKYKEIKANIFSDYMKKEYKELCNYVHGRGDSFMKKETDRIEFNELKIFSVALFL
jgi:hypothetical protein